MSQKSNRIIGAVVALAAVGGVVAGVLLAKPAADLDPSTPQGVVQGYLRAAFAKDYNAALTYLDPAGGCTAKAFDSMYLPSNPEVSLLSSSASGATAIVEVKVTYNSTDIFAGSGTENHTYRLTRVAGNWRITNVPWPLFDCGLGK